VLFMSFVVMYLEVGMVNTRSNIIVIRITCNVNFSVSTFPNGVWRCRLLLLLLLNPLSKQLYCLWPSLDSAYIFIVSNGRGLHTMRRHPQEEETAIQYSCQ